MDNIVKTAKPKLKQNTIDNYVRNINKLYREIKTDKPLLGLKWLYSDKIQEFIDGLKTDNTRRTYYSIVITLIGYDIDINKNYDKTPVLKSYIKKTSENHKAKTFTDNYFTDTKNEDKVVDMKLYDTLLTKLKEEKEYTAELLFTILKLYPFRNEVKDFIVVDLKTYNNNEDISKNYLVINKSKMEFVRNQYKTSNKFGVIKSTITDKGLKKLLKTYIKDNSIGNGELLFKSVKNTEMSSNQLTTQLQKFSNKYIGVKLSTGSIFKSVISSWINEKPRSEEEMKNYLTIKGNIRGTNEMTIGNKYVKASDKLSNEKKTKATKATTL